MGNVEHCDSDREPANKAARLPAGFDYPVNEGDGGKG